MKKRLLFAVPFLLAGCLGEDSKLSTFKLIDSIGGVNYAVVAEGDRTKKKALHDAAKEVCDDLVRKSPLPPTCYVLFWTDISKMPSGIAMTGDNQAAVVAQYVQKPGAPEEFYLMKDGAIVP